MNKIFLSPAELKSARNKFEPQIVKSKLIEEILASEENPAWHFHDFNLSEYRGSALVICQECRRIYLPDIHDDVALSIQGKGKTYKGSYCNSCSRIKVKEILS